MPRGREGERLGLGTQGWLWVGAPGRTGRVRSAVTTRSNSVLGAKWGYLWCSPSCLRALGKASECLEVFSGSIGHFLMPGGTTQEVRVARSNGPNSDFTK